MTSLELIKRHGMIMQGRILDAETKEDKLIKNLGFILYMDSKIMPFYIQSVPFDNKYTWSEQ